MKFKKLDTFMYKLATFLFLNDKPCVKGILKIVYEHVTQIIQV